MTQLAGDSFKVIPCQPAHWEATRALLDDVFDTQLESALVADLRSNREILVEFIATSGCRVLAYAATSTARLQSKSECQENDAEGVSVSAAALGPLAVCPSFQNKGLGRELITRTMEATRRMGNARFVVFGHPQFYKRFGFVPANHYGLNSLWGNGPELMIAGPTPPEELCWIKFAGSFNRFL